MSINVRNVRSARARLKTTRGSGLKRLMDGRGGWMEFKDCIACVDLRARALLLWLCRRSGENIFERAALGINRKQVAFAGANQRQRPLDIGFIPYGDVYAVGRRRERDQRVNGVALGVKGFEVCAGGD